MMSKNPGRHPGQNPGSGGAGDAAAVTPFGRPFDRLSSFSVAAWCGLVGVAVVGRLWQPTWNGEPLWNVTPLAAVALAAGTIVARPLVAASVPLAGAVISNLFLPAYGSIIMAVVVYAALAWPVLMGGLIRRAAARGGTARYAALAGGSLASSLVFFLTTNFACWAMPDGLYPHTAAGLTACFTAALPFYRWMPAGDLAWTALVFAGMALVSRVRVALTAAETA